MEWVVTRIKRVFCTTLRRTWGWLFSLIKWDTILWILKSLDFDKRIAFRALQSPRRNSRSETARGSPFLSSWNQRFRNVCRDPETGTQKIEPENACSRNDGHYQEKMGRNEHRTERQVWKGRWNYQIENETTKKVWLGVKLFKDLI